MYFLDERIQSWLIFYNSLMITFNKPFNPIITIVTIIDHLLYIIHFTNICHIYFNLHSSVLKQVFKAAITGILQMKKSRH